MKIYDIITGELIGHVKIVDGYFPVFVPLEG